LAERLNQAQDSEADLENKHVYAAAGFVKDGIIERIQRDMAEKFPEIPVPQLDLPRDGAVAYGYLAASVKFEVPFFNNDEAFQFTDAAGKQTAVRSFGIQEKHDNRYFRLRRQVQILHSSMAEGRTKGELKEFILDLCNESRPYQIVLACVKPGTTLAASVADVQMKIKKMPHPAFIAQVTYFGNLDTLLIPEMSWSITHRFKELEGLDKKFQNPALHGFYLHRAFQMIQFKLDKSGADLRSEAESDKSKSGKRAFLVNRPFLVYITRRDNQRPFFVMWVDNAELLCKQ
jgi:hypothetical protein